MKPAQFHLITTLLATGAASFLSQTAHAQEFFSPALPSTPVVASTDLLGFTNFPTVPVVASNFDSGILSGSTLSVGGDVSGASISGVIANGGTTLAKTGNGSLFDGDGASGSYAGTVTVVTGGLTLTGSDSSAGSTTVTAGTLQTGATTLSSWSLTSGSSNTAILGNVAGTGDTIDTSSGLTIGGASTTITLSNLGGTLTSGGYGLITYSGTNLTGLGGLTLATNSGSGTTFTAYSGTLYFTLGNDGTSTTSGSTTTNSTSTFVLPLNASGNASVVAGTTFNLPGGSLPTVNQFNVSLGTINTQTLDLTATPEPSSWVLALVGLGALALMYRRSGRA